jgi:hypothetical protein
MKTITLEDGKEVKISDESYKAIADSIQSKRWKPEEDEGYWYTDSTGAIYCEQWGDQEYDKYRYKTGNIYRTEKEAKTALARIIALADVREYILDNDLQVDIIDWSDEEQDKWVIYYDHDDSEFYGEIHRTSQYFNEPPYLKSTEATNQVIQAKKKELLVILNVK